ncbi:MAG: Trk system potassium transporter TrkA [Halobacteriales archaeon]
MYVVVVGAGEVGSTIAASLSESHEVAVVDVDPERVETLTYELDVLPVEGDGTDLATLQEAGIERADLFIASTDDDETNIVASGTAATQDDAFTLARVRSKRYLQTWRGHEGAFGIDFMVCTDLLTAETLVGVIGLPAAVHVDTFASGTVRMAEFEVPEGSPLAESTIQESDRFDEVTFVAVVRDEDVILPTGETVLHAGDDVVVVGTPAGVRAFGGTLAPDADESHDVVILGGTEIGYETARLLEGQDLQPRLIERDEKRSRELAETLPATTVLAGDATDRKLLEREHVGDADVVVATMDQEERNLLGALLAGRVGAERTVAVVESGEYVELFKAVGVDVAVNPRTLTGEEITRFTRERRMENVSIIEDDQAEVIEIEIDDDSALAERRIGEATGDFPEGVVIGAITRDGEFVTPRGDTIVEVGDHVVVLARQEAVDETINAL